MPVTDLDTLRTLAREWAAADTTHRDDFLRGYAVGMADAGRALLERIDPRLPVREGETT